MSKIDLSGGGLIVVAYGNPVTIREFEHHPNVKWVDTKVISNHDMASHIPVNTRLIIMNEGVPNYHYLWLTQTAQKTKTVWLMRKSSQAIYEVLKNNLETADKVSIEEAKETQMRGRLAALIPFIDSTKSNAENARQLINKALELGIKTTEGSLSQYVSNYRRKNGQTAIVKSARSQLDISVDVLDEAIKGLTDIRDYLIATAEENRILKSKVDKFKKLMDE